MGCEASNTIFTLAFFQLLMQGGIFHSFCSLTVTFLVGECSTGAGGDGGPLGIFLLILKKALSILHEIYSALFNVILACLRYYQ